MVYLRCTDAPTNIPMAPRDGRAERPRVRNDEERKRKMGQGGGGEERRDR